MRFKTQQFIRLVYFLTYACYPSWRSIGRSPSYSILDNPFQSLFIPFMSASNSWLSMFLGLPLFCFPPRSQVSPCFVKQFNDFHNVCPRHFQHHFLIFPSAEIWFILSYSWFLLMISGQQTFSILRRQLFINTCTLLMIVVIILQVSAPYSRTVLKFVLRIVTLMLVDSCFEFHILFNCRNVPSLVRLNRILLVHRCCRPGRYVDISTSSRASSSSVISLVFSVLCLAHIYSVLPCTNVYVFK
ncbi:unnamed protein product [Schistosoma haematobium]|nr:unnamed protein product [Schistosoma haematobium]